MSGQEMFNLFLLAALFVLAIRAIVVTKRMKKRSDAITTMLKIQAASKEAEGLGRIVYVGKDGMRYITPRHAELLVFRKKISKRD